MTRATFHLLLLWTVAGVLARSSATRMLGIAGVTPDLLTLLVVYWGLAGGARVGVLAGFVVGLVADADTGRFLGLTAGALAGVGFLVGSAGASLHRERPPAQFVVLFFAGVLTLGVRALFATGGNLAAWLAVLPVDVALRALYTALLGPLLYLVMRAAGAPDFLAHGPTTAQPRG
jgi:rod shape-determining protein MreD